MNVVISGTGAMACLFAARLSPCAHVTLLGGWREAIAAVNSQGILVSPAPSCDSPFALSSPPGFWSGIRATDDAATIPQADLAIVLVKSWQTERAARQLARCLRPEGLAVTLQNGIGNLEVLQRCLGEARSTVGATTYGATLLGPAQVRESGIPAVRLGAHPRAGPAIELFRKTGFAAETTEDTSGMLWGKLVVNAAINPLTALLRVPNGELLRRTDALSLMEEVAREAAEVARARGIALPFGDPAAQVREVAGLTAGNCSSMLQDVRRGVGTEIDAISGAICREAHTLKVPAPLNCLLWRLVGALIPHQGKSG